MPLGMLYGFDNKDAALNNTQHAGAGKLESLSAFREMTELGCTAQ